MRHKCLSSEHTLVIQDVYNKTHLKEIQRELFNGCNMVFTQFNVEKIVPPTTILHLYPNRNIVIITFYTKMYFYINSSPNPYREDKRVIPTICLEPTSVYWIELDPGNVSFTLSSEGTQGGYCLVCSIE